MKRILKAATVLALLLLFASNSFAYLVTMTNYSAPANPSGYSLLTLTDTSATKSTLGFLNLLVQNQNPLSWLGVSGVNGAALNTTSVLDSSWKTLRPMTGALYTLPSNSSGVYTFAFTGYGGAINTFLILEKTNTVMTSSTPIPGTLLLLGPGIAGLAALRRKFKA